MMLYIDETENEQYFIVVGLLANTKEEINHSFKHFKKYVNSLNYKPKDKQVMFIEFKSVMLDRKFQKVKSILLNEINKINCTIYYSYYKKEKHSFKQSQKEKIYINLLEKIVSSIDSRIDVIYDGFSNIDFESKIEKRISILENINSICSGNSQNEAGLKYVDNICSTIRLHISNEDKYQFYSSIKNIVIKV